MKIVADENLAFIDYFFADMGQVVTCAGRTLTTSIIQDADALLVRSVTQVNQNLLQDSAVQFVGSATIGIDHLDIQYLNHNKIEWCNAAGCNAQAVAEYVITALLKVKPKLFDQKSTLGIVGLGNVGTRLAKLASLLGWNVIAYDPYVEQSDVKQVDWVTLLKQADIVSIHVPLTMQGQYPTYHLFNTQAFLQLKPTAILVNSARGAVVSETALLADIAQTNRTVVLDVFEHEPQISETLLNAVTLVTPHIAGYSLEGKARGTQMIYDRFCQYYHQPADKDFRTQLPVSQPYFKKNNLNQVLHQVIDSIYDISQDDQNLRACVKDGYVDAKAFDALRKDYPLRREWTAHGAIIA